MRTQFVPGKRTSRGFSLVEVTLAIGITAVALVSLMGMLPRGMQTLQKANDKAVMARINQQILGEIQVTPWEGKSGGGSSPLEAFDGSIRFYDDQGIELPGSAKGNFEHVYTARITMPKAGGALPQSVGGGNHKGVVMPGGDMSSAVATTTRLVMVEITSTADPQFLENPASGFDRLTQRNAIQTFRTMVSKMGQQYGENSKP